MSELSQPLGAPNPEHAYRHKLTPEGRESLAHILLMPEHNIAGFIYPTMLGTGVAKSTACFFSPDFPEQIVEVEESPVADTMNFGDWHHGPLHMAVIEPLKKVNIAWNGKRIRFAGAYTATHPAYAFSSHPRGNPPYFGDDRTEQHGRVIADLELDGRKLHHEGFLIRDHSWGPRVWGLNQHYKWIHATTGDSSMHFFEMQAFGRTELRGFLFKDGEMRHVAQVDYDFVYDEAMLQKTFDVTVTDSAGRKSQIAFTMFGMLTSSHDTQSCINTGCATLDFDGKPGVGVCEFAWNKDYFDFAKDFVAKYG
ncbi:hypothetical protein [Novosphingobium sp.]|uniref:DUF7064 domain-containing protein n=1 Tax=Novosphingobium sp. TaxID=1874826 RepID=UPI00260796E9|nr:hypothetical protein [Novosphingobium sp.]